MIHSGELFPQTPAELMTIREAFFDMIVLGRTAQRHSKLLCPLRSKGGASQRCSGKRICLLPVGMNKAFHPLAAARERALDETAPSLAPRGLVTGEKVVPSLWCRSFLKSKSSAIFSRRGALRSLVHGVSVTDRKVPQWVKAAGARV